MSEAIQAFLNKLRSALGTGEYPDGSNHNFITEWYNKNVDRIGDGPWCEMTVTWALATSGAGRLRRGRAYTVWAAQDAQRGENGSSWHWGTKGMRAGDMVYFDWGGRKGNEAYIDHVEAVEKVLPNGTFVTLGGNVRNRLVRVYRDSKYVVGYTRLDWARLDGKTSTPKPKPPTSKVPTKASSKEDVKRFQKLLRVDVDGVWGPKTDDRAIRLRVAAKVKSSIRPIRGLFSVTDVQKVIGTTPDGVWGPKSQAALVSWIKKLQAILGIKADGVWGPVTERAFLNFRARHHTKR